MQTTDRENSQNVVSGSFEGQTGPLWEFHPEATDDNFVFCLWITLKHVVAVVVRYRDTERARGELYIKISGVDQQIRSMEREAEARSDESCRNHSNPRSKISMMDMDMLHVAPIHLHRKAGTQKCMHQRLQTL